MSQKSILLKTFIFTSSEMFDFAQSPQRNEKEKENLSRFPVWKFIDPFFRLSLPRLHFLTLATKTLKQDWKDFQSNYCCNWWLRTIPDKLRLNPWSPKGQGGTTILWGSEGQRAIESLGVSWAQTVLWVPQGPRGFNFRNTNYTYSPHCTHFGSWKKPHNVKIVLVGL